MHFMLNAYWKPLEFQLPDQPPGADGWRRVVDTHLPSPNDIVMPDTAPVLADPTYIVGPRSVAVVFSGTPAARAGG
jgi:glycogen operon protein